MQGKRYPEVKDRPEVLNPGDVWVDYKARQVVLHVNDATELRFSAEEADKFFTRFQGLRLSLHDSIRLERDRSTQKGVDVEPFRKQYAHK